ncbi:MAG: hypothetical protein ACREIU_12585 [Planctomycetota bacterium]
MRTPLVLLAVLAVAGCVSGASRIERSVLPAKNPTYYEFDLPLEDLRAQVIAAFTLERQFESPVFGRIEGPSGGLTLLYVREAGEGTTGTEVPEPPGNERDLYVEASHSPLWGSPVYRGAGRGLPFLAEFHLHFVGVSPSRTGISVAAHQTEVINGSAFGLGMCGPGWFNRYVPVEATSIEEYRILRYIGGFLGVRSMPENVLPAP